MEKAAEAGASAGTRWETASGAWALWALAACMAAPAARAQDTPAPAAAVVAQAQIDMLHLQLPDPGARVEVPTGAGRVEVQTSTLPRFDAQDSGFQAPRVDVSVLSSRRSYGFSPVLGVGGIGPQQSLPGLAPMRPSFDVGLRWTQRLAGQQRVDITAWRRMNTDYDAYTLAEMQQPVYGARVELNLSPVRKPGFALDHGFIGVQLESGARISIKRKDGHPMVYYRTAF